MSSRAFTDLLLPFSLYHWRQQQQQYIYQIPSIVVQHMTGLLYNYVYYNSIVVVTIQLVRRKLFFSVKSYAFPRENRESGYMHEFSQGFLQKKKRRMYQASHLLPLLNMQVHRDLTILRREKKLRSTYGWAFEWQDMREKLYLFTSICKYLSNSIL